MGKLSRGIPSEIPQQSPGVGDQKVKGVSNYPANSDTTNGKHTYADVVLKKKE